MNEVAAEDAFVFRHWVQTKRANGSVPALQPVHDKRDVGAYFIYWLAAPIPAQVACINSPTQFGLGDVRQLPGAQDEFCYLPQV